MIYAESEYSESMMPRRDPVAMEAHALENLRYIRGAMERAGSFTAVPGLGGVIMGATAIAAAWIAGPNVGSGQWLGVWMAEAVAAVLIGFSAAFWKARRQQVPLLSGPGRKFVAAFAPAMLAGVVLTGALWRAGAVALLPAVWLLLYGAAVVSGGGSSVRAVWLMGVCFMAAGCAAAVLPGSWGNGELAAGFGGLHVIFGTRIAMKYGG